MSSGEHSRQPGSQDAPLLPPGTTVGRYQIMEQLGTGGGGRVYQFSYAVTLFLALTGQKPFAAETLSAYLDALTRGERAEWPRSMPRRIREVVERGLATRADERYPDVRALVAALEKACSSVERIRELVSSMYPPDDWRYLTIPFVSGSIWHDSGQCERALPLYREAFATVERTYGATNSNTADVEAKLGSCLHALGQDTEAVTHLERVLEIRGGVGSAPNVVAEAAFQLAEVLAGRGARERDRAIALAERALASWREDGVTERAQAAEEWLARQRSPKVERTGRNRAKKVAELGPGSTRRLVHHPGH